MHEGPMEGAKGGGIEGERWEWVWWEEAVAVKWRHLYSNINLKSKNKNIYIVSLH